MIGAVLNNKYHIEKKIGEGGFGVVYRALDINLKRPVAIKQMSAADSEGRFRSRFMAEAESLARLQHPNIVTIFDFGEHEGHPYIVMELVRGRSLAEILAGRTLALEEVRSIALQMCAGMSYAHAQGVIHRDLTLRNVMTLQEPAAKIRIKILDFGLARLLHGETQTSDRATLGTPTYLSPEQVRGETVDKRTDIFSFGVGLFRMVNGRFPFEAEHPTALMYLIVHEPCGAFAEGVPDELRALIQRCLEKDPRARPGSFDDVAHALGTLGGIAAATDQTTVDLTLATARLERSSRRNPYLNRVMIRHPSEFFGRQREVRKIYSRLDAPHPQSISIVGERRIGKSSLLNYIYHPANRRQHMQQSGDTIMAYLDFQMRVGLDVATFIDFLFSVFNYETREIRGCETAPRTLESLKEVVAWLHGQGKRIVILMDEFEAITRNERFDAGFFSFLRSLANSYRVAYVTSSREELQRMCHNQDIADSPFFNIFSNLPLRPFGPEEAIELITRPSAAEGVPLEPYAGRILGLAGCFPIFLQMACASAFEHLLEHPAAEPDWEAIRKTFADEASPHYSFVWEGFDAGERENVRRVVFGETVGRKYAFVTDGLVRRGYLVEHEAGIRVFSESFGTFVRRSVERERGRRGRATGWWRRIRGQEG